MDFKVGQLWATNLPGRRKLRIMSLNSQQYYMFPMELKDDKGNKFFATDDGFLKQVVGPNGLQHKLTILIREYDPEPTGKTYREREEVSQKIRENNNRKVLHEYKLKK